MAVLNIRNLPDEVRDRLRMRAARKGKSMEAEAREILTRACLDPRQTSATALPDWVDRLYGKRRPRNVTRSLIDERRRESRRK